MARSKPYFWLLITALLVGVSANRAHPQSSNPLAPASFFPPRPVNPAVAQCQAIWDRALQKTGEMASELEAQTGREPGRITAG